MEATKDPTKPSLGMIREVAELAWPSILENLAVTLTNMIDTFMVSPLGPAAVAAIGITVQPHFLFLAPILAMNVSLSALVARRKGAEDRMEAHRTLVTVMSAGVLIYLLIALSINRFADPILAFLGSNPEIHDEASSYIRILLTGSLFNILAMHINSAQSGTGNTRVAFFSNAVMSLCNAGMNYLLIEGHFGFPALGVSGAAIASVTAQAAGFFVSFASLFRDDSYLQIPYLFRKKVLPALRVLRTVAELGINILVENLLMRIGFIITAQQAAGLGTEIFATHNAGMNLLNFGFALANGMQTAAVATTGSALGAGRKEKAMAYGRACEMIGIILSILWAVVLFFFGGEFFGILFHDKSFITLGERIARYIMIIVLLQIQEIIFAGALRAAGDVKYTLVASMVSVTLIRSVVTLLLVNLFQLGIDGIWMGILAHQVSIFFLMWLRFRKGEWVHITI